MNFELLANEILQEIFEYLDISELFRAFSKLNQRFNRLLFVEFRAYRIDCHTIAKYQFQQDFSTISQQIVSLRLTDKDNETNLFFSLGYQLNNFTQLRSLSLSYINSNSTIEKLINECSTLQYLTHLQVVKCHPRYMSSSDFSKTIWNLQNLSHCHLETRSEFKIPTNSSSTLKSFSITSPCWGLKQTIELFQSAPQLEYVRIPINTSIKKQQPKLISLPIVTKLNLCNVESLHGLCAILRLVPNLIYLKVDTFYVDLDGYRWKELIESYLPKLKEFHLRTRIVLGGKKNTETYVDKLLATYSTPFWIEKHRWFVRCHLLTTEKLKTVYLYTIPYGFSSGFSKLFSLPCKSTELGQDIDFYDRVINLDYNSSLICLPLSSFSSIRNLSINFCFDKEFWMNIPIFYSLVSVTILSTDTNAQYHLQALLDRTPNLQTLTICSWPSSAIPIINRAIRRVNLQIDTFNQNDDNGDLCRMFIQSNVCQQCEELQVRIKNRQTILELINGMPKLRILQIQYSADLPFCLGYEECQNENEMFMKWLEERLPNKHRAICEKQSAPVSSGLLKIWIYLDK